MCLCVVATHICCIGMDCCLIDSCFFLKISEFIKVHIVSGMCHSEGILRIHTWSYHFSSSSSVLFIPVASLCPSTVTPLASDAAFHCNDIPPSQKRTRRNSCDSHSSGIPHEKTNREAIDTDEQKWKGFQDSKCTFFDHMCACTAGFFSKGTRQTQRERVRVRERERVWKR